MTHLQGSVTNAFSIIMGSVFFAGANLTKETLDAILTSAPSWASLHQYFCDNRNTDNAWVTGDVYNFHELQGLVVITVLCC